MFRAAVFHCQQAAEKALKGFLAWHDVPFRKTHTLKRAARPVSQSMRASGLPLTGRFRLPNMPGSFATPVSRKILSAKRRKMPLRQRGTSTRQSPRFYQMRRGLELQQVPDYPKREDHPQEGQESSIIAQRDGDRAQN
jgi:hypothetical protein